MTAEEPVQRKKLICFDMDSTLVDCETLEVLAEEVGLKEQVNLITNLAMNGELDFEEAVRRRLDLLKGFPVQKIEQIAENIPLMPGAKELIPALKKKGFVVGMITGSYDIVARKIARKLDLDFFVANNLEIQEGKITGGFALKVNQNKDEHLLEAKKQFGSELTIAVGDGAIDLPMLKAADIGIAFCAKPKVNENIHLKIKEKNLLKILDIVSNHNLKIVIDKTVHEIAKKSLALLGNVEVVDTLAMDEELIKTMDVLVIRSNRKIDQAFLDKADNLKIIATATTGTNHIDLAHAKKNNVKVVNAGGENAHAVADYIFRMLFHAIDDVHYTNELLKNTGNFKEIKRNNVRTELRHSTLGIVGLGNVGTKVAERASAFGMEVKAFDPYSPDAKHTLKEVLRCDFITLHPELTKETKYMIDQEEFNLMKEHAILINASRGAIVKEQALIRALKEKKIKLAILDVYENEGEHTELYELENTLCTPHIAGNTVQARANCAKRVFAEILGQIQVLQKVEVVSE